jgi:cob(I)alamin adenosyltransferase
MSGNRLSKITTKTGDAGFTDAGDGERIPKYHHKIEFQGSLDDFNSHIGLLYLHTTISPEALSRVQNCCFTIGGFVASGRMSENSKQALNICLSFLESDVEKLNSVLPPLKEFILPVGET